MVIDVFYDHKTYSTAAKLHAADMNCVISTKDQQLSMGN
jgi:hypothetical protein